MGIHLELCEDTYVANFVRNDTLYVKWVKAYLNWKTQASFVQFMSIYIIHSEVLSKVKAILIRSWKLNPSDLPQVPRGGDKLKE